MTRTRLPDRRAAETVKLEHGGTRFMVTIGFYPDGRPGEVFTHGARSGSSLDALLADACVVVSCLIQHGVEPRELAASMGRLGNAEPASIIGAVVDLVAAASAALAAACRGGQHMTSEQMLQHAAAIIAERGAAYGDAAASMSAVAARWSITLGHTVTPAQVVLCMIDLKLTRLAHDPTHHDSAARRDRLRRAAAGGDAMRWTPRGYGGERRPPEKVKQDGWREQGLLAVSVDDQRLTWPEREFIRQLGEKLYGKKAGGRAWITGPSRWSRSASSKPRP